MFIEDLKINMESPASSRRLQRSDSGVVDVFEKLPARCAHYLKINKTIIRDYFFKKVRSRTF